MRRWMAAPLVFAAAAVLTAGSATPQAAAQDKKYEPPTPESITTADGVTLRGLFHKSPTAAKHRDQVVILMYPPGGGRGSGGPRRAAGRVAGGRGPFAGRLDGGGLVGVAARPRAVTTPPGH